MTATITLLEVWCWMVLGVGALWLVLRYGIGGLLAWIAPDDERVD